MEPMFFPTPDHRKQETNMTTVPLPSTLRRPDGSLPDVHIYPVGAFRTMPSVAHEQARAQTTALLRSVASATDLVASELAVLFNMHDLRDHLVPDILVALDVGELDPAYGILRRQYRIWDEGKPPDLIVEYASPTTVRNDNLGKKEDYAAMGVQEYVQFDPLAELLEPRLLVYRLQGGVYEPVPAAPDGHVASVVMTGYDWLRVGMHLRLRDRATGNLVPTAEEARAAAEQARVAAEQARAAAEERAATEAAARRAAEQQAQAAQTRTAEAEAALQAALAELERLRAREDRG
jgi:Uma2 family endonuclease